MHDRHSGYIPGVPTVRMFLFAACIVSCGESAPPRPRMVVRPMVAPAKQPDRKPGELLHEALGDGGHVHVPPGWIAERADLADLFPVRVASSARETWLLEKPSVCRRATYDCAASEIVSTNDIATSLLGRMTGNEEYLEARYEKDGLRVVVSETRVRMGHMKSGPLSAPITEILACVEPASKKQAELAAQTIVPMHASLAKTMGALELEGVRVFIVTYKRGSPWDEIELVLLVKPDAQVRLREWFIARGLGVQTPGIPWALDSTDKKRSFIFYEPRGDEAALVTLYGR